MEQTLKNILGDLLRRDAGVVPSLDNAVDGVCDNGPGDVASGFIQQKRKVVFGKERVCGIRSVPVIPHFFLIVRVDDSLGARAQSIGSGTDQRLDERLECGDDEHRDRIGDLLDKARETGNAVDGDLDVSARADTLRVRSLSLIHI